MTESVNVSYVPESARRLPHAACTSSALTGTFERGDSLARPLKNRPSRANANGMRELESTLACNDPKEEIIIATAVNETARGPRKRLRTSVATEELVGMLAMSSGDNV